jgi:hypothetical protein
VIISNVGIFILALWAAVCALTSVLVGCVCTFSFTPEKNRISFSLLSGVALARGGNFSLLFSAVYPIFFHRLFPLKDSTVRARGEKRSAMNEKSSLPACTGVSECERETNNVNVFAEGYCYMYTCICLLSERVH